MPILQINPEEIRRIVAKKVAAGEITYIRTPLRTKNEAERAYMRGYRSRHRAELDAKGRCTRCGGERDPKEEGKEQPKRCKPCRVKDLASKR